MGPEGGQLQALKDELIRRCQEGRKSLPEAGRDLVMISASKALVDRAISELQNEMNQNVIATPSLIDSKTWTKWYYGPSEGGHWSAYRQKWKASGKPGLNELDRSTTDITGLLANPASLQKRKGLVLGNVQSGKTGNFAGVIAKAADAGYRLIIVMSGLHNSLRQQTQRRLVHDVLGPEWTPLTGRETDIPHIDYPQHAISPARLTAAVVKKNPRRLQNLIDALKALSSTLERIPVLIIDDEADQATPNSQARKDELSAINRLMRELWGLVRVGTYLAYTATPFANVLMDPDDSEELFPSDFITLLTPGDTYFGAERVFGAAEVWEVDDRGSSDRLEQINSDGLDMVRTVPTVDSDALRPPSAKAARTSFVPPVVPSLAVALRWFIIATTVRHLRGHDDHSSMLIHTTHYTGPHLAMKEEVKRWLEAEMVSSNLGPYEEVWLSESHRVAPDEPRYIPPWDEIAQALPSILHRVSIVVDNGVSDNRLSYAGETPEIVIAIGGGTLSRGLTLEGLVVSYFTRTSNTYDTLMQMGRWFGYRDGYEDLPRLWVAQDLDKDYAFLARVERDLRTEIESLSGSEYTPAQVGVKVRYHPGRLEITSVGRMKHARVAQLSLSGVARQTFLLDGTPEVTHRNRLAVESLLNDGLVRNTQGRLISTGISSQEVRKFIDDFSAHPDQTVLQGEEQKKAMREWLDRVAHESEWSVVVAENTIPGAEDRLGTIRIAGHEIRMVNRAPLKGSTVARIDFKAIMSPSDWIADIRDELDPSDLPVTPVARRRARRVHGHGRGLVIIYPISERSTPSRTTKDGGQVRIEMPTDHPLLGYAIIFPYLDDKDGSEGTFVSVRTEPITASDYQEDEEEEVEIPEDTEDGEP